MSLKPWLYDLSMRLAGARIDERREALASAAAGRVLELGVGTGQNLRFYGAQARVIAIEPDPAMLERAIPRAAAGVGDVVLVRAAGERLPFRDGVFDQVVVSLVLCSVGSPAETLGELRRVLKPGGRLRFYEHVRSDNRGWAAVQDLIAPFWKCLADGCCPNRPTVETIEQAGFEVEQIERFPLGPYPTRPQVLAVARRD